MIPFLLDIETIRSEYGIARDTAALLVQRLPNIELGTRGRGVMRKVRRAVLERFLERLEREQISMQVATRVWTGGEFSAWFEKVGPYEKENESVS